MTKIYLVKGYHPNAEQPFMFISNVFTNKRKAKAYIDFMTKINHEGKTPMSKEWRLYKLQEMVIDTTDYGIPF